MADRDDLSHYMEATSRMRQRAEAAEARVAELESIIRSQFEGALVSQGDGSVKHTHTINPLPDESEPTNG